MDNNGFKKGHIPWNKGKKAEDDERIKRSTDAARLASKGKPAWNKGIPMREESKKKLRKKLKGTVVGYKFPKGHIPWNRGKKFMQITGARNRNWRGGITPENDKQRKSIQYKEWRSSVLQRDSYTCVLCHVRQTRKCPLIADHIKPFALFPELKFEVSNGRSLCKQCDNKHGFKWNRWQSAQQNKALVDNE